MTNKVILLVEDNPDDELLTLRTQQKNNVANEFVVVHDSAVGWPACPQTGARTSDQRLVDAMSRRWR